MADNRAAGTDPSGRDGHEDHTGRDEKSELDKRKRWFFNFMRQNDFSPIRDRNETEEETPAAVEREQ